MTLLNILRHEVGAEILKAVRAPEFAIPTLAFPLVFYFLFGIALSNSPGNAQYLLATYGVFAVLAAAVFGFGVPVAVERENGWLTLKRTVPAPPFAYIFAKIAVTFLFSAVAIALLYSVAAIFGGVRLETQTWAALFFTHILAAIPFILIGLLVGFSLKPNGAVAVANIVLLGLAVLGGLWMPIAAFPKIMQSIALGLPTYHLGEIALYISGAPGEHTFAPHFYILTIMSIFLTVAVVFAWRRQRY